MQADEVAQRLEVVLEVQLGLDHQIQADNQVLEGFDQLSDILGVLVRLFGELFQLLYDLLRELGQLALGEGAENSLAALLIEVLHKDSLYAQLCTIDRVLKVLDLRAEGRLDWEPSLLPSHATYLAAKLGLHLGARLLVPDELRRLQLLSREQAQELVAARLLALQLQVARDHERDEELLEDLRGEEFLDALVEVADDLTLSVVRGEGIEPLLLLRAALRVFVNEGDEHFQRVGAVLEDVLQDS